MDTTNVFGRNLAAFLEKKPDGSWPKNHIIINQGGTSSSKTFSILQLLILIAHRRKYHISVVSETMPHLKKGALKDFMKIIQDEGIYDEKMHNKSDNIFQFNNGKIEFFSADAPGKVHGPRRDILYVNEAINIPWEIFDQMNIRTSICTFIDFNPCSEFWCHEYFPPSNNIIWLKSTYKDNRFLPQKIVEGIEAKKDKFPEWWKVYGLGEVGHIEGVIYDNWKQVSAIPKDAKRLGFGLDFGFSNDPTAIVEVFMQDGELWVRELLYETGLTNRDLSKKMEEIGIVRGIDEIWADSAEPKSIKELRDAGWFVRGASKGPDSIRKGIDLIRQYPINVTSDSLNLIRELRYYKWQRDKMTGKSINKPENGWDHLTDAMRYLCVMKLKKPRKFLKQWN